MSEPTLQTFIFKCELHPITILDTAYSMLIDSKLLSQISYSLVMILELSGVLEV